MELYLREVEEADMDLLFRWANDPDVRRSAFHTEAIPYETHVKWFHRMLENEAAYLYILCRAEEAVGQIRLDIEDGVAVIDYSVAPGYRGRGFGRALLTLIKEKAMGITGVTKLVGQVKPENSASIKAFEQCGYVRMKGEDYITFVFEL